MASGARSLRKTGTRAGVGTTPGVVDMVIESGTLPAMLGDPAVDDIFRAIEDGHCLWCGDSRVFSSLSGHWTRGHGFVLQEIRDLLKVPKQYAFISDELRAVQSANGKRHYDSEKLRQRPGQRRELSAVGLDSQRANWRKWHTAPEFDEARREANRKSGETRIKSNICVICDETFRFKGAIRRVTCSRECDSERRRRGALSRMGEPNNPAGRKKWKECAECGAQMSGVRVTCSSACEAVRRSAFAASRTDHIALMRERMAEELAARPPRFCDVDGCGGSYRAKGLCGMHYQRSRAGREVTA